MFTADPDLKIGITLASRTHSHLHQKTDSILIEGRKRIAGKDFIFCISGRKGSHIIPADTQGGLGEIISAKAEELGSASDASRHESGSWHLNHRSHGVGDSSLFVPQDFRGNRMDDLSLEIEFTAVADQWHHDLRSHPQTSFSHFQGLLKHSMRLHFGNLRISNPETATAVTEHRIKLVQLAYSPGNS